MKRSLFFTVFCAALVASAFVYALTKYPETLRTKYVTWDSLEPDKWASIWLIKNYIDPDAIIEVRPTGDPLGGGILFGVPDAEHKRTGTRSAFESLLAGFHTTDPVLQQLGWIITEIETTSWNTASDPLVHTVEHNFRRLQDIYERTYVPVSCYAHFFDVLYGGLSRQEKPGKLNQSLSDAVKNQTCDAKSSIAERKRGVKVQEIPIERLLTEIAVGQDVVFVDTREPAEFKKSHIPGAVNIPMRNLNEDIYQSLRKADRVISYCVKDFRGYEVARQMQENGVRNVAVMNPYGLSGWQSLGLPLTLENESDVEKQTLLQKCAKDQQLCPRQQTL